MYGLFRMSRTECPPLSQQFQIGFGHGIRALFGSVICRPQRGFCRYAENVYCTLWWMILVEKAGPREYVLMYIAVIMTRRKNVGVLTLDAVEERT